MGIFIGIVVGACITLVAVSALIGWSVLYDTDNFVETFKRIKREM